MLYENIGLKMNKMWGQALLGPLWDIFYDKLKNNSFMPIIFILFNILYFFSTNCWQNCCRLFFESERKNTIKDRLNQGI
jgi:hypothetical protein